MVSSERGGGGSYSEPRSTLIEPVSIYPLLASTARNILEEKDSSLVLQNICREACRVLEADRSMIAQVRTDVSPYRTILSSYELPEFFIEAFHESSVIPSILEDVSREGPPKVIPDIQNVSPVFSEEAILASGHRTTVVIPLNVGGKLFGELALYHLEVREYTKEEIYLAGTLGDLASLAIENSQLVDSLENRIVEQVSLQRALRHITNKDNVDEITQAILEESESVMGTERCGLVLYNSDKDDIDFFLGRGVSQRFKEDIENLSEPFSICRRYISDPTLQAPSIFPDLLKEDQFKGIHAREGHKSMVVFPLKNEGKNFGILIYYWTLMREFDDQIVSLGQAFADHVSVAIQKTRLLEKTREDYSRQQITGDIARAIGSMLEPDKLFQAITREIRKYVPCDRCVIVTYLQETEKFHYWQIDSQIEMSPPSSLNDSLASLARAAYKDGAPAYCPDISLADYSDSRLARAGLRSVLVIPIMREGEAIAHITLSKKEKDAFSDVQIRLLVSVAGHLASAFRNASLFRQSEERASRLAVLHELNRKIAKNLDLAEVLDSITQSVNELLHSDAALIYFINEKTGELVPRAQSGSIPELSLAEHAIKPGAGVVGKVLESGEGIVVADVEGDPDWVRFDWIRENGIHSYIGYPLMLAGKVVGVIAGFSQTKDYFSPENMEFLSTLSSQAAIAIENARLYRETEERGRQLGTLVELGQHVSRGLDFTSVLDSIVEAAATLFNGDAIFRLLEGDHLVMAAATPGARKFMVRERVRVGVPMSGLVAETGEPMFSSDPENDSRLLPELRSVLWGGRPVSVMVVPVRLGDRIVGTLGIYREKGYEFGEEVLFLANTLADQAAIAVENSRLHEEARRSRDFFQSVVDDNADAIIVTDKERRIVCWNTAAENLYGYTESEVFGRSLVDLVVPEGQRNDWNIKHKEQFADLRAQGRVHYPEELRCRKDGTLLSVEVVVSPVKNEKGEIVAFCSFNKDLTNRKLEEEMLIEAKVAAEKANMAKTEFLSNVTHELRSPLNSVIGFSELLLQKTRDGQVLRFLPKIRDAGKYLASLIDDLRDMDRIESAKMKLDCSDVHLNDLIQNLIESWTANLPEGFSLEFDMDPGCGVISCDPVRIRQVLYNLFDNSIKYSSEPGKIRIKSQNKITEVWVSVQDQGVGLGPGEREIIFDRFRQIGKGTSRAAGGMGIGLYLVHQFLAMHGGHIWVDSELGQGSTFTFALPKGKTQEIVSASPDEIAAGADGEEPWAGCRLLVVDDLEMFHLYASMLMASAEEIYSAYNGEEGVEMARRFQPDIILMDMRMPIMNGYEAIACLKGDPAMKDIPIIAVTAQAMEEDRALCFQAGADSYATKPIDRKFLAQEVWRLLNDSK